jgi:G3E family GTPase
MKIANIVTTNKVDVTDDINVVKDVNDTIEGIPTLVTSYDWVSKNYDDYEIYDKKLEENLFWTFARTERRDIFASDVESFITLANKKLVEDIDYIFIDLIQFRPTVINKIVRKLLSINKKIAFKHKNMVYIYGDKLIFGLDLGLVSYMGLNVDGIENKIKSKCSVFLEDNEIFIEYKDNMERLDHSVKYIPYLYYIKNE